MSLLTFSPSTPGMPGGPSEPWETKAKFVEFFASLHSTVSLLVPSRPAVNKHRRRIRSVCRWSGRALMLLRQTSINTACHILLSALLWTIQPEGKTGSWGHSCCTSNWKSTALWNKEMFRDVLEILPHLLRQLSKSWFRLWGPSVF